MKIYGFRLMRFYPHLAQLRSVSFEHTWTGGTQEARCAGSLYGNHEHASPASRCGFYAFSSLAFSQLEASTTIQLFFAIKDQTESGFPVHAAILALPGRITKGATGWRAARVRLLAIARDDTVPGLADWCAANEILYCNFDDLETIAQKHGVHMSEFHGESLSHKDRPALSGGTAKFQYYNYMTKKWEDAGALPAVTWKPPTLIWKPLDG